MKIDTTGSFIGGGSWKVSGVEGVIIEGDIHSFTSISYADGCKPLEPGYEYSLSKSGFFIKADSDVYRHLVSYTLPSFADGLMVIIYSGVGLICLLIFVVVVAALNRKKIPDDEEP